MREQTATITGEVAGKGGGQPMDPGVACSGSIAAASMAGLLPSAVGWLTDVDGAFRAATSPFADG